jgi:subtilisin family serine protease
MTWPGHLVVTLKEGERFRHVPAHLDCLIGAGRPASRLDGGEIDRALIRFGGAARTAGVFHAKRALGRPGEHHVGFDALEESLGLSRTYRVEIAEKESTASVLSALRDLDLVESAGVQTLACAPLALTPPSFPPARVLAKAGSSLKESEAWEPREQIGAREALAMEPGDQRVTSAVIDTGVIVGHRELQRKCLAGYDTVDLGLGPVGSGTRLVGDSRGHDFNPIDEVGHGCGVAGIIAGQGWRMPPGVGGATLLLPIRVLAAAVAEGSTKPFGIGCLTDIDAGIKVAVDLGAWILNMSLGTPESSVDKDAPAPHQRVCRYAAEHGCILVAAAGNSGREERFYPAALEDVIAVASVDREGRRSSYSTSGRHLAISAPGERIVTAALRDYQVNSGTSFASPFVAGVCALMASRALGAGRRLDGATTKRLLLESALPLGGGGFSVATGHGLLNAPAALRKVDHWLRTSP